MTLLEYIAVYPSTFSSANYAQAVAVVPVVQLQDITADLIHEISEDWDYAPTTANLYLSRLQCVLDHATKRNLIEPIELDRVSTRDHVTNRMKVLNDVEEKLILSEFRTRGLDNYADCLMFMIDTGCRPSELLPTPRTKADPSRWTEVKDKGNRMTVFLRSKTGVKSERTLPLSERVSDVMVASRDRGDDTPLNAPSLAMFGKQLTKIKRDCLMDGEIVPYTMRHTCATRLVQRGADLTKVMKWMGHSNYETTLRYAKLNDEDMDELVDLI